MPRIMIFKTADPSRRIPTYLQAHTKENFTFQLKGVGLLFVGIGVAWAWDEIQYKKKIKKYAHLRNN